MRSPAGLAQIVCRAIVIFLENRKADEPKQRDFLVAEEGVTKEKCF